MAMFGVTLSPQTAASLGRMVIHSKDAAIWGDMVTPNIPIYAFLFCQYGCKGAVCTKLSMDQGTRNS